MPKQIIWDTEAVSDRVQIYDYWYERLGNEDYAGKLDQIFIDSVNLLSRFPLLGHKIEGEEKRVLIKDHYHIYYHNGKNTITILHIWDSRRNPDDFQL